MTFCTYCGQQFQRNEHLERHLASHTNLRRFKCHVCHISFARADALQRHASLHGENAPPTTVTANGRSVTRRTPNACASCAKAKVKCDSNSPCKRCAAKQLQCSRVPQRRQYNRAGKSAQARSVDATSSQDGDSDSPTMAGGAGGSDSVQDPAKHTQETLAEEDGIQGAANQSEGTPGIDFHSSNTTLVPIASGQTNDIELPEATWLVESGNANTEANFSFISNVNNVNSENEEPALQDLSSQPLEGWWDAPYTFTGGRPGTQPGLQIGSTPGDASMNSQSPDFIQQNDRGADIADNLWVTLTESLVVAEHQAVIEALQFWSCFRCNPTKDVSQCPRTGGVLIGSLSQMPLSDDLWGWLSLDDSNAGSNAAFSNLVVTSIQEQVRDKLSAISQSLLRKALRVHRLDPAIMTAVSSPNGIDTYRPLTPDASEGFLILPPAATLEHFLFEYMRLSEPFYLLMPGGVLDPNALMKMGNPSHSTILLLLMIGQGAMTQSTAEARRLSGGLTEACRISLFDVIEKNVPTSHQYTLMHSALLFTLQATWSGDKWLMDIGLGQRGIYMSLMHHAIIFERLGENLGRDSPGSNALEQQYHRWRDNEIQIRLAYNWMIVDLELSLFHDVNTVLSTTQVKLPIPYNENVFLSNEVGVWEENVKTESFGFAADDKHQQSGQRPSFQLVAQWFFLMDFEGTKRRCLNPTILHVLLHAVYTMIRNYRQIFSLIGTGSGGTSTAFSPLSRASTTTKMEEVQYFLRYWLNLFLSLNEYGLPRKEVARSQLEADGNGQPQQMHPRMCAMLITYHLISLNTISDLPAIEGLFREGFDTTTIRQMPPDRKECYIQNYGRALFHAGQVLYLERSLESMAQPLWWPAALYRATMVLTATSILFGAAWQTSPPEGLSPRLYIIDGAVESSDTELIKVLRRDMSSYAPWTEVTVPALTTKGDPEKPILLNSPEGVLMACIQSLDTGRQTRFADGIRRKLKQLLNSRTFGAV